MEPKDHGAGKVEIELSWFKNWTSQIYSIFLLIPLIVLCSPQDSLHCHLQEENSVMDQYWSWIAQWLEHQHIKLETGFKPSPV